MPVVHQVAGLASIEVDTGTGVPHAREVLGYTRDGAGIRFDGYWIDIPCDTHGGEQGPPSDIQILGETALITLDLTKWDEAVIAKIKQRAYGQVTEGLVTGGAGATAVGSLMIGGALTYRLIIGSLFDAFDFPVAIFREPIEINKGTKYSTYRVEATAYRHTDGYLYKKYATYAEIPALYT